jgi:cis-3-alkyl-4-acyloxetan-2-one decarboxylase
MLGNWRGRYNGYMKFQQFDRFWHQTLGRPYYLARAIDNGSGQPIILLHGIGRTGQVWEHVIDQLPTGHRIVAFDLLGFGASPKPDYINYAVDDHAQAVISSIEKLRLSQPVTIVGHSMGCLVAVRVARTRPDLVNHLVLYEMPLYEGLPEKRRYRLRTDLYVRFYKWIIQYQPTFDAVHSRLAERLAKRVAGLEVTPETWVPFIRSLEHTIMHQTTADDIKALTVPMDVIYGTFDMLVIRGKPHQFFGSDKENIVAYTVRAGHVISPKASRFIVERIMAAGT